MLNCYQMMGGSTMIFCNWIGLTVKSSYLVKIVGENIKRTVKCCEITLSANDLNIGKNYTVIVGPSTTIVSLKGMTSFIHLNLIAC